MDDDDFYPKNSILERMKIFMNDPTVQCLGCTQLNQFHTIKMTSIKNKSSDKLKAGHRIFESTLAYTKKFWEKQKFDAGDIYQEGRYFLKNRSNLCEIIEPTNIIVGLIHKSNQDSITGFADLQPNGWHFEQIPDDLFLLITSL